MKIGDVVAIIGSHPWSGSTGEIVRLEVPKFLGGEKKPVIRLHDTQDHEVFVTDLNELQVLKPVKARK